MSFTKELSCKWSTLIWTPTKLWHLKLLYFVSFGCTGSQAASIETWPSAEIVRWNAKIWLGRARPSAEIVCVGCRNVPWNANVSFCARADFILVEHLERSWSDCIRLSNATLTELPSSILCLVTKADCATQVCSKQIAIAVPRPLLGATCRLHFSSAFGFRFLSCSEDATCLASWHIIQTSQKRNSLGSSFSWVDVILPDRRCLDGKRQRKLDVVVKITDSMPAGASLEERVCNSECLEARLRETTFLCKSFCASVKTSVCKDILCVTPCLTQLGLYDAGYF